MPSLQPGRRKLLGPFKNFPLTFTGRVSAIPQDFKQKNNNTGTLINAWLETFVRALKE